MLGEVWKRPGLSPRDRSIVTVAALIARNQAVEMPSHFNLALDNGVKPGEMSEVITHLAFYSGWGNAMAAVAVAKDVYAKREDRSRPACRRVAGKLLPLDEAAEAQRAARVEQNSARSRPGVVKYTTDVLFRDLWLRPALAPRDRSLVTVSALVASGQVAQIPYHLNRAMDNGLTKSTRRRRCSRIWRSTPAGRTSSRRCRWSRTCSRSALHEQGLRRQCLRSEARIAPMEKDPHMEGNTSHSEPCDIAPLLRRGKFRSAHRACPIATSISRLRSQTPGAVRISELNRSR